MHNLYFIAYAGKIFVYQPRFPTQALPSSPVLVIDTQPSGPGLRGDIDSRKPHAINNLVVQVLGHSEVLAVGKACSFLFIHYQFSLSDAFEELMAVQYVTMETLTHTLRVMSSMRLKSDVRLVILWG